MAQSHYWLPGYPTGKDRMMKPPWDLTDEQLIHFYLRLRQQRVKFDAPKELIDETQKSASDTGLPITLTIVKDYNDLKREGDLIEGALYDGG